MRRAKRARRSHGFPVMLAVDAGIELAKLAYRKIKEEAERKSAIKRDRQQRASRMAQIRKKYG